MAAQEQALNTRAVAHKIYHTVQDPWCISSTAATSSKGLITLKDNNVVEIVYRVICAEYNFERSKDWWVEPEKLSKKILLDFLVQTDKHLFHNRPDIVLINYKEQTGLIIDIAVSRNENTRD